MATPKAYSYTRMSTLEQLKGDSRRRQRAGAEDYAKRLGLEIEDRFDDWGISAYRGRNAAFGALKIFQEKVEAGEIAKGSHLIVESMDRLSRQPVLKALSILTDIVNSGVVLVTLDDNQVYSSETIGENSYRLIIALGSMARAHEESRRKSGLVAAAWKEKKRKARAEGTVTTRKVPGWLTVTEGKVIAIPTRVAIVNEIFTLTRDGWGAYSVCRLLNARKEPVWSTRANAVWRESYIKKMIASRTVLGEYQPHLLVHREDEGTVRVPDGDAVLGYYPAVVSHQLFSDANAATDRRRTGGRGRKGVRYANLFSGLLRCSCGSGFRFIDKGPPPKGGKYLQCSVSHLSGACSVKPIRYELMEGLLLEFLETLDVERVLGGKTINSKLDDLRDVRAGQSAMLLTLEAQVSNIADAIALGDGTSSRALVQKLKQLESSADTARDQIAKCSRQIEELIQIDPDKRRAVIDGLLERIRADNTESVLITRRALVGELQRMLEKIVVRPNVRIAWELMDEHEDWKSKFGVSSASELEKRCKDLSFDLHLIYRSGDVTAIDAFDGPFFRARGSIKMKNFKFSTANTDAG